MSKKKAPKHEYYVGEKLFVVSSSKWRSAGDEPVICYMYVKRFNGSSVYLVRDEDLLGAEYRFSIKDLTCDEILSHMRIYFREEDYYESVKRAKQKAELREKLTDKVSNMTLKQLVELDKIIS